MRVRVILNADQQAHAAEIGEPMMCDQMPWAPALIGATTCRVGADLEIDCWFGPSKSTRIKLCRVCAEEFSAQLRECLDLIDARDVSGWKS